MNKQAKIASGVALGLMILTAGVLQGLQKIQRLGTPGVKVIAHDVLREDGVRVGTESVALPERVLDWGSTERRIDKVVTDWLPKDTVYAQRLYTNSAGAGIMANVVLMGTDRTSIHDPKYCMAGQGFQTSKVERDEVEITEPFQYSLPLVKMTISREVTLNGTKTTMGGLYVFWFVADGQVTADHKERMWWMARDLLTRGVLQRWAYVSCFTMCELGQEEAAYAKVKEWIAAAVPQFQLARGTGRAVARAGD